MFQAGEGLVLAVWVASNGVGALKLGRDWFGEVLAFAGFVVLEGGFLQPKP